MFPSQIQITDYIHYRDYWCRTERKITAGALDYNFKYIVEIGEL